MKDNVIAEKSFQFAASIVRLYQGLSKNYSGERVLFLQLLRCGTSIGANVHEAIYAQSRKDFVSKCSIALKEASETEYWLRLLQETAYLKGSQAEDMLKECKEVRYILTAIVNSAKKTE